MSQSSDKLKIFVTIWNEFAVCVGLGHVIWTSVPFIGALIEVYGRATSSYKL